VSQPYHGVTIADVELMVIMMGGKVGQGTIRQWLNRGNITRSRDGLIDPESVINWWETQRKTKMIRANTPQVA
jgi:hypothetical protein